MPPRYAYWTILAGGLPTSFRAATRDELLPTFKRLQQKHPDAELKWFSGGRLWNSPNESTHRPERRDDRRGRDGRRAFDEHRGRDASSRPRGDSARGDRPPKGSAPPRGERRGRDWRPGGEHRDPRQRFEDARKARNLRHRERKFERRQLGAGREAGRDAGQMRGARREPAAGPAVSLFHVVLFRPRADVPAAD